jgi:hypothetical protein
LPAILIAAAAAGGRMVEAHLPKTLLYGLLVKENNFGIIVEDLLDYPAYFPDL